jgi:hypothetical protein
LAIWHQSAKHAYHLHYPIQVEEILLHVDMSLIHSN